MTIPSPRSLSFREKHWERARVYTRAKTSEDIGSLRKSSEFFGRLRSSSGIFGNDRVVFKIPGTARIKISRLYLRKSWQVYNCWRNLKICRELLANGLASHQDGVEIFPALPCYRSRAKPWQLWASQLKGFTFLVMECRTWPEYM